MDKTTLRGVILYMIVMGVFAFSLLYAMTSKADAVDRGEYTCAHLKMAMSTDWGERMAIAGARKFLRTQRDSCVVMGASSYTYRIQGYCLEGHKLSAAKTLALTDVVTACALLGPEKETK